MNITHNYSLGIIKWYPDWRQYCFFTNDEVLILSAGCTNQVQVFLQKMNKEQKDKKHGKDNE